MNAPRGPEVLSDKETALDLDGHGFSLYRVGDEAQLRDADDRVVLSGPWEFVPIWIKREFRAAVAGASEPSEDDPPVRRRIPANAQSRHPDDSWVPGFNASQRSSS